MLEYGIHPWDVARYTMRELSELMSAHADRERREASDGA